MIQHRHANFEAARHRRAIDLGQDISGKPSLEIDILGHGDGVLVRGIGAIPADDFGRVVSLQPVA